jgi:hypothetical protein
MNIASEWATRACFALFTALPICAFAESASLPEVLRELTLDIDRDGKPDRAVLVRNGDDGAYADLYIYLGSGADPLDLGRKPTIVKRHLIGNHIYEIGSKNKSSLLIGARCGGCSNDDETILTIVHRGGEFLIGGFSKSWELRDGSVGSCDVNYLTGKGVASRGLPKRDKPIRTVFHPVKLADWSETEGPRDCRP